MIIFENNIPVKKEPRQGIPLNSYKQFKAIDRSGDTYYMSGVINGH